MRAASIKELKTELELMSEPALINACLRLAKFKKESKELLTYILFEENNEEGYIQSVKAEIDLAFIDVNIHSTYIAKKNLRRIIRLTNKYCRYSAKETTETTLLIYVCTKILEAKLPLDKSTVLKNIYASLLKRINKAIDTMHEDLQYDYRQELKQLENAG